MSTNISRRKVVAGAAWAAPVVAASAAVPAFASSTECKYASAPKFNISGKASGSKNTQKFTVPAKVDKIRFEVAGGAGGGSASVAGGSGALITGEIPVKEGQVIELVAAAGGVAYLTQEAGVQSDKLWVTRPATGGEGYGNGGDVNSFTVPSDVVSKVTARWSSASDMNRYLYGGSGGGSSALVVDGTVVALAGGGGGAGMRTQPGSNNYGQGSPYYNKDAKDMGVALLSDSENPGLIAAGASASAATGDTAETGVSWFTHMRDASGKRPARGKMMVAGGAGGGNGTGGAGGEKPELFTAKNAYGFASFVSTNNQEIYSSSTAGNQGGNGFDGKGADGVSAYSYEVDNNDPNIPEKLPKTDGSGLGVLEYPNVGYNFNGYQGVVSAGGGAGYGGGGSGAARALAAIQTSQKWNGNSAPNGLRQNVGTMIQAGAGGAGGSYVAPSVAESSIASAGNGAKEAGTRNPGYVKVTLCERS